MAKFTPKFNDAISILRKMNPPTPGQMQKLKSAAMLPSRLDTDPMASQKSKKYVPTLGISELSVGKVKKDQPNIPTYRPKATKDKKRIRSI